MCSCSAQLAAPYGSAGRSAETVKFGCVITLEPGWISKPKSGCRSKRAECGTQFSDIRSQFSDGRSDVRYRPEILGVGPNNRAAPKGRNSLGRNPGVDATRTKSRRDERQNHGKR